MSPLHKCWGDMSPLSHRDRRPCCCVVPVGVVTRSFVRSLYSGSVQPGVPRRSAPRPALPDTLDRRVLHRRRRRSALGSVLPAGRLLHAHHDVVMITLLCLALRLARLCVCVCVSSSSSSLKPKFHGSSFLVASSQHVSDTPDPRNILVITFATKMLYA